MNRPAFEFDPQFPGTKLRIKTGRHWASLVFLAIWLCGWLAGEAGVATILFLDKAPPPPARYFLYVWLTFWTIGGVAAIRAFLQNLLGHEELIIHQGRLEHFTGVRSLGSRKVYAMDKVSNLRLNDVGLDRRGRRPGMTLRGSKQGLVFDHNGSVAGIGMGLSPQDSEELLQRLIARHSAFKPRD
jgi:hypothetical protein